MSEQQGAAIEMRDGTGMAEAGVASVAHALHLRVLEMRESIASTWLHLGAALRLMRDEGLYGALGYETFEAYLASPEVAISRTNAYRAMDVAAMVLPSPGHVPTLGHGDEELGGADGSWSDENAPQSRQEAEDSEGRGITLPDGPDASAPQYGPAVGLLTAGDVAAMGMSKAEIIAPLLRSAAPEERESWIADARALTVRDLKARVREARGTPDDERRERLRHLAGRISTLAAQLPYASEPGRLLMTIGETCRAALAEMEGV